MEVDRAAQIPHVGLVTRLAGLRRLVQQVQRMAVIFLVEAFARLPIGTRRRRRIGPRRDRRRKTRRGPETEAGHRAVAYLAQWKSRRQGSRAMESVTHGRNQNEAIASALAEETTGRAFP